MLTSFDKNAYAGPHTAVGWNIFEKKKKTIVGFRILEIFLKLFNSTSRCTCAAVLKIDLKIVGPTLHCSV